jgi:hypothetical protein
MKKTQKEILESRIKFSGLNVGDCISSQEPIGKIDGFEMVGSVLYCVVGGSRYVANDVHYCPDPEVYKSLVETFRKRYEETGEPCRIPANEAPEVRQKRLDRSRLRRMEKKEMGRAKSGRKS